MEPPSSQRVPCCQSPVPRLPSVALSVLLRAISLPKSAPRGKASSSTCFHLLKPPGKNNKTNMSSSDGFLLKQTGEQKYSIEQMEAGGVREKRTPLFLGTDFGGKGKVQETQPTKVTGQAICFSASSSQTKATKKAPGGPLMHKVLRAVFGVPARCSAQIQFKIFLKLPSCFGEVPERK